ncbi:hypothetical protein RvY_06370 [Ramazzottius varieornatus]|uniref:Uncharacterized protein n=1 Tax=Ramazzottius varieornatus TaxID=947166 RepID=A0A1D1UYA5_RAMVA|nr:hypothetical protein RvY_06370 [Ramazzottius varieornatus]
MYHPIDRTYSRLLTISIRFEQNVLCLGRDILRAVVISRRKILDLFKIFIAETQLQRFQPNNFCFADNYQSFLLNHSLSSSIRIIIKKWKWMEIFLLQLLDKSRLAIAKPTSSEYHDKMYLFPVPSGVSNGTALAEKF